MIMSEFLPQVSSQSLTPYRNPEIFLKDPSCISREETQSMQDPTYDYSAPGSVEPLQHNQGEN